ncbi:MAG: tRNA (N(6)-L-threonylcarbamoyladenosine(37)-C(2))-methylthiotransferase MtaB [Acidobacteria bacterium]|nr:tRNA (N(6)-L-threonylcarbamoyladenosine(37)-C(2))-methylthiotransferase MtaB [Acidobacteriota bacterium]MBS1864994.1 tRNA (N(6)-L-threonylcarbamoyladenosine(37)-C(2))-methylthiotransferase MtaB [Acidobacteriota bacterium]
MSTFYIEQFGCRATQADGAAIERQLLDRGCTPSSSANSAEFVVINTCTVTSAADAQARDAIRKIHAQNPAAQILVTGCYAQRAPEELAALPGVSHVVGNSHKPQIPSLITAHRQNFVPLNFLTPASFAPQPQILNGDIFATRGVLVAPVLGGEGNHTRPILKIQDGCNNRCSFCVIPYVRGKSRSLPPETVLSEIRRLSESGFQEIVLSGINLGSWGRDLSPRAGILDLLRRILGETDLARLRISSIEPLDVTQDLIALFAGTDRIADHFHMPLQSGSDNILSAMHRWYRTEHYARRVNLIREFLPNAAIGADVIAGFPGETEADHEATLRFIGSLPFTYLHVFSYSSRPGTKAAALDSQLPGDVIHRRARELRVLGEFKSEKFRESQLGRSQRVLTLNRPEKFPNAPWTPALSSNYLQFRITEQLHANQFLEVRAVSVGDSYLSAELDRSPQSETRPESQPSDLRSLVSDLSGLS